MPTDVQRQTEQQKLRWPTGADGGAKPIPAKEVSSKESCFKFALSVHGIAGHEGPELLEIIDSHHFSTSVGCSLALYSSSQPCGVKVRGHD
jgi:hypothetical protein